MRVFVTTVELIVTQKSSWDREGESGGLISEIAGLARNLITFFHAAAFQPYLPEDRHRGLLGKLVAMQSNVCK